VTAPKQNGCPPKSSLHGFSTGNLEEADAIRLTEHLTHCETCVETIDSMRDPSDTVIDAIRRVDVEVEYLDEPELTAGLQRLGSLSHAMDTAIGNADETTHVQPNGGGVFATGVEMPSETPLDRPETLGSYRLIGKLGQGGMGAVYKAVHGSLDKTVAVKVLSVDRFGNRDATQRFTREMKAMGRVQHPNVVVAHDGGDIDGEHFLVMEYVDGIDISALAQRHEGQRHQGLPVPVACEIVRQAAVGLQHAHDVGLIHRDIKPGNLMLDQSGVVKVLDLGLARISSDLSGITDASGNEEPTKSELTSQGTAMGTMGYMAPEQALDSRSVDARADLYSLGATLYKLLAGTLPFPSDKYDTGGKMLVAIATQPPPSIASVRSGLPPALVALVDKMLSKEPNDRVQTAAEFAEQLRPFAGDSLAGVARATAGSLTPKIDPKASRSKPVRHKFGRWPLVATGLLGLLAIGLLAAQVFFVRTEYGTLKVEIADEQVEAKLKTAGISVIDNSNKKVWDINASPIMGKRLPKGQYKFQAPAGLTITDENGLEIAASEFKLLDKEKQLRIRVSFAEGFSSMDGLPAENSSPFGQFPYENRFPDESSFGNFPPEYRLTGPAPAIVPFDAEVAKTRQADWATHVGIDVETSNSIGMKLRVVPPGEFLMGTSQQEMDKVISEVGQNADSEWLRQQMSKEMPQRKVRLTEPFLIGIHEVTRGQFRRFVEATGYKTDAETDGVGGNGFRDGNRQIYSPDFLWNTDLGFAEPQTDDDPVVNVSWNDAVAFCSWLSDEEGVIYRLPTEAQWEFACRSGSPARFSSGDRNSDLQKDAWIAGSGFYTHPVGRKRPNAFGLFDMHGNVFEWCTDIEAPYEATTAVDPVGPAQGPTRILRGGSFVIADLQCRSAYRLHFSPESRSYDFGFRVVRNVEPKTPENVSDTFLNADSRQALFEMVSSYDGKIISAGNYDGNPVVEAKRWEDIVVDIQTLEINFQNKPEVGDRAMAKLAVLLNQMDLKENSLTLQLRRTSVSGKGLMSLRGLAIKHLDTVEAAFDISDFKDELTPLSVQSWRMGGGADAADIAAIASMPSIESIAIDINPNVESDDRLHQKILVLRKSNASRVVIGSWGEPSTLGERQIDLLKEFKAVHLTVGQFLDITPAVRREWHADRLCGDGHEFGGTVSVAETVPDEFVMEFDAVRTSDQLEGLGIHFRFAEQHGLVVLGGWDGTLSAMEQVDGAPGESKSNRIQVAFDPFQDGQTHRVRLEVFRHAIGVQVDGEYLLWWHGDPASITHFQQEQQSVFGEAFLRVYDLASFRVANLSINPLPADAIEQLESQSKSLWQETNTLVKKWGGTVSVGPSASSLPLDEHLSWTAPLRGFRFSFTVILARRF